MRGKSEIRNSKLETNSNSEFLNLGVMASGEAARFELRSFGLVSDFVLGASDFLLP